jgi:hypothetical protein
MFNFLVPPQIPCKLFAVRLQAESISFTDLITDFARVRDAFRRRHGNTARIKRSTELRIVASSFAHLGEAKGAKPLRGRDCKIKGTACGVGRWPLCD